MITISKRCILLFLFMGCAVPTQASVIDTSIITVNASGSLNTIGGFGSIDDFLVIPNNATFNYFTVELSKFTTTPATLGLPRRLSLDFRYFNPFSPAEIAWYSNTDIFIGKTWTVSSSENSAAFYKMQGFIVGSGIELPQIYSIMSWGFGGVDGNATASFIVTAHGDVSPIPLPASIWIFGSGLLGIFSLRKRNSPCVPCKA